MCLDTVALEIFRVASLTKDKSTNFGSIRLPIVLSLSVIGSSALTQL
jgi:hypothetical protein